MFRTTLPWIMLVCLVLAGCANPVSPKGGPKDEMPPTVVWDESSVNLKTQFDEEEVTLVFDEFVELNDPVNQIVVSPPLQYRLQAIARKEEVRLTFDERETLKPNTTYTINMGTAIKDFTEGNEAENVRYVFSTGDYIDSASLNIRVTDFETGEPVEDVVVMLFEAQNDSALSKGLPYYFGRTNTSGAVTLDYLREDTFQLYALQDANNNYILDDPEELVGFMDESVIVSSTVDSGINLPVFKEVLQPIALPVIPAYPGAYVVPISGHIPSLTLTVRPDIPHQRTIVKDSMILWAEAGTQLESIIVSNEGDYLDTLSFGKKELRRKKGPPLQLRVDAPQLIETYPQRFNSLPFNMPIRAVDTSRFRIIDTGGVYRPLLPSVEWRTEGHQLHIRGLDKMTLARTFVMLPGSITGFRDSTIADTLQKAVRFKTAEELSKVFLEITNLEPEALYQVELYRKTILVDTLSITGDTAYLWKIPSLNPTDHEVRIYLDRNRNGLYDSGFFMDRRYPEPILIKSIGNLRPNWDVEAKIEVPEVWE